MTKVQLRHQLKLKRQQLTPQQVTTKSKAITSRVISTVDWKQVKAAHCYVPIGGSNEVETAQLQDYMRRRGIYIQNPGTVLTVEEMTYNFDLIIVPTLGFDRSLHRLGYGGGFYDRLLQAQPKAQSIGLSYDACLIEQGLPIETHDQQLALICTETASFLREPPSK